MVGCTGAHDISVAQKLEILANLQLGFSEVFSNYNYFYVVVGAFFGTWIGMLPGIGPATGIALLLPFTYGMNTTSSLIMLSGIYFGAMYGGAISSILINTPGDASSVITAIDGNPLARKGRAGAALFINAIASFVGGMLGLIGLTFLAVPLSEFALKFGPAEYFMMMVFAIIATSTLIESSPAKGVLSGVFGLMISTVGIDLQSSSPRFTFGLPDLMDGINLLVVIIGVFCISEAFINIEKFTTKTAQAPMLVGKLWITWTEWIRSRWALLRGAGIGFIVGLFPGAGGAVATAFAYAMEKRISARPEEFGHGAIEAVAAPESANNASVSGALIPMLTLGIPGSASTAIMLGALMIYGIEPGPQLFQEHPRLTWGLISSLFAGNFVLLFLNIPLIGLWVRLLKIPSEILTAIILLLALTGSYAIQNSLADVGLVLVFGVMGYAMRKNDFPTVPMLLGVILGHMLEQSLRQALMLSVNDWTIFFTRPLCAGLLALCILCILVPVLTPRLRGLCSG